MSGDVPVFGTPEPGVRGRPRPAAYAVVFDDAGRVASVTEASGLYLPGGGLDTGEDPGQALHREVAEECAREIEIIAPLGHAVQYYRSPEGEAIELHAHFFLARFGEVLDRTPEHEMHWEPAQPEPAFFHDAHRWAVARAWERREEAQARRDFA